MVSEGNRCAATHCKRPVEDGASLCGECWADLEDAIRDLPVIALALDAAYLRQQRFSVASIAIPDPDESTVPFNDAASRCRRELSRLLLRWVMHVESAYGLPRLPVMARTTNTTKSMSAALAWALPYFRVNPVGGQAHDDIVAICKRSLAVVDRPPDLVYLGLCSMPHEGVDCQEDLYAEWGAPMARCRRCKHTHRVDDRRSVLIVAVKDQLANASDIARGLSGLDMAVTAERIRQWKVRGRILSHSTDQRGNPLYRVGDVIDLVLADAEKEKTKPERKNR